MQHLFFALTLCFFVLPFAGNAEQTLTVENNGEVTSYTMEDLLNMPQIEVTTMNNYVDEPTKFSGPLLRTLLEQSGIGENEEIELHALNDFFVSVPTADAYSYDVILAIHRNDEKMSVRDKGPIWVIYPMDDHAELFDDVYNGRLVWQLDKITAQ